MISPSLTDLETSLTEKDSILADRKGCGNPDVKHKVDKAE